MKVLSLQEVADFLETAEITETLNRGQAVVHIGKTDAGHRFVLINDMQGNSCVSLYL